MGESCCPHCHGTLYTCWHCGDGITISRGSPCRECADSGHTDHDHGDCAKCREVSQELREWVSRQKAALPEEQWDD